jgi:hypothetical protein
MDTPLAELREVSFYCIGGEGFHLRGLERVMHEGAECDVLQGWLVTVVKELRDAAFRACS